MSAPPMSDGALAPTTRTSKPARRLRLTAAAILAVGATLMAGCSSGSSPSTPTATPAFDGDQLGRAVTLTTSSGNATFSATTGHATTLDTLQQGKLMLLYFGYTHCPDVCPTTMADLGQALRQLPSQVQAHVQVVFVTSDPARDTPTVLHTWLSNFDSGLPSPFIGLTGSLKQIDSVATSVGVPLEPPQKEPNGTITVEHGAQTLAFVNGKATLLWTADTKVSSYVHDINKLANTL